MQQIKAAFEAREKAVKELRDLASAAEGREFSGEEREKIGRIEATIEAHDATIRSLTDAPEPKIDPRDGRSTEVRHDRPLPEGASFRDLSGGSADVEQFGNHLRDIVEGRAQSEGTGSAGGFLVPTPLAAGVIDLAVNNMRTRQAGARIVPMSTATLKMASLEGRPTPAWRAEAASIGDSSATFGQVSFTARSLAVVVKASVEALEDAPALGAEVQAALGDAFAIELDRVGIYGTGVAPQPKGLKLWLPAGSQTTLGTTDGADATYDDVIAAVAAVRGRGYDPKAALLSTRTDAAIRTERDLNNQFVAAPAYLSDVRFLASAGMPTDLTVGASTDTADIVVGDFSYVAYGIRSAFSVRALTERYADEGMVGFLATLRADVQLLRGDAFQLVSGVTN
ncbi:phage major capsid protein [Blastococcus tunisiensis]|nr:phage major capsid protein [Blastococcus sp. DSM 46838]